jgi:hypothetical protein
MELKSLSIRRRESYEAEKGFTGELQAVSPSHEIKIRLSDESCRKILIIAGVGIQEAALETQAFLTTAANTLADQNILEMAK